MNKGQKLLEFGEFRVDVGQRLLFRRNEHVPMAPKAVDTLLALLQAEGQVVSKEDLLKTVWPDAYVEEGSLARNISILRKALGENPDDQKYIQTIPKRGYRFVAAVVNVSAEGIESGEPGIEESGSRRRAVLSVGAAIVGLVGLGAWRFRSSPIDKVGRVENQPIESIAVLPLENLSGDLSQEYFSDGITDSIITNLAQIGGLKVISRTSMLRYKGTKKSLPEIARELGVDSLLEGSVRRQGNRVRVTVQLIHAVTDVHIWAHSFDRELADTLRLEGELAAAVAEQVQAQIGAEAKRRLRNAPRISPAAQDEYLLALHQMDVREENRLQKAIQHLEGAIEREPSFAAAHASLGRAWIQRGVLGRYGFREAESPARRAALRALELDPTLADAHSVIGQILAFYDFAWSTAEEEFRKAIALEPSNVSAHIYYANLLQVLHRSPEALEKANRALSLDPLSAMVNSELGRILFRAGKYPEAIRQLERTLELEPDERNARGRLADVYIQTGRIREALDLSQGDHRKLARVYALLGERQKAHQSLKVAEANNPHGRWLLEISLIHFALGDKDRGFQVLTASVDHRQFVLFMGCDPRFQSVRTDPRFDALLTRLRLPRG